MNITEPRFIDETAAREWLEAQRWPDGRVCPHCGNLDQAKITGLKGKAHRPGVYQCNECREQFTVTVGSVMERSKLPLTKWVMGLHLMAASKKGVSAHQLHRMLGITYKTAWFMAHRLREAMRPLPGAQEPMGGEGKIVEADETYFGKADEPYVSPNRQGPYTKRKAGAKTKMTVVSLVERGGSVRSFHPAVATKETVGAIVKANISQETRFMTDESRLYLGMSAYFAQHQTVKHTAGEYVNLADRTLHTNTIENYFSVFKRGMRGIYQHCAEKHLHRYLAEFDFRYNTRTKLGYSDYARSCELASGIGGKRLTYRRTDEAGRYLHG